MALRAWAAARVDLPTPHMEGRVGDGDPAFVALERRRDGGERVIAARERGRRSLMNAMRRSRPTQSDCTGWCAKLRPGAGIRAGTACGTDLSQHWQLFIRMTLSIIPHHGRGARRSRIDGAKPACLIRATRLLELLMITAATRGTRGATAN